MRVMLLLRIPQKWVQYSKQVDKPHETVNSKWKVSHVSISIEEDLSQFTIVVTFDELKRKYT